MRWANHPGAAGGTGGPSVVLLAWVLWRLLRILSRRRLDPDHGNGDDYTVDG